MSDDVRIGPTRIPVLQNPASIAFAQVAEQHRLAGSFEEAVRICRAGLAHHPGHLSARVTLGQSLLALGELEDAAAAFVAVLRGAPDHLAALTALADIHESRGEADQALACCRTALALLPRDRRLAARVAALETRIADGECIPAPDPVGDQPAAGEQAAIRRLEQWLDRIVADRSRRQRETP